MPTVADLITHRDHRGEPTPATPAPRRRRRSEPHPRAAAALQRALDLRDNGGVTGHLSQ